MRDEGREVAVGQVDDDKEDAFMCGLDAALRAGLILRTTWAHAPPTMSTAAWRAVSDCETPLLGDDLPYLCADDGSTRWAVCLDRLTADYGHGRTAIIAVSPLGCVAPTLITLLEGGEAVYEAAAEGTLDAMERADEEAVARGWLPAARTIPKAG